jgi:hypothetical protein
MIGAAALGAPVGAQNASGPTFNKDVAPIIFNNCAGCHRPGDVAPMSLLTYEQARPYARAIKARVAAREMPPWPPDPRFGKFRNPHTLTDAQVNTLVAWADADAPQGTGNPPRPPRFVEGWTSQMDRPPDQIIEAPLDVDLPASGIIPQFKIYSKMQYGRDRFLEAIELRPINRAVVHHASVFRAKLPIGSSIGRGELWSSGPVMDGVPFLRDGRPAPDADVAVQPLIFYVPSGGFIRFPRGVAKRIQLDDYLQWTFHLVTTGKIERAGARIGLWFSRTDPDHEVFTWKASESVSVGGRELATDNLGPQFPNIPPNEADFEVTGVMKVNEPITLYALWPHMHYRGRDMTFVLVDRNGKEETLLSVPKYSFAWQFTYELASPRRIAQGSLIKAIAHYDNSSRNKDNPNPNEEVTWGPQANNEMFDPYVEITYDRRLLQPDCNGFGAPSGPPTGQPGGALGSPCR